MMLWKVLLPLCLLCLSGLTYGDEDFQPTGDSKRKSEGADDKSKTEEAVTENIQLEDTTEDQTHSVIAESVTETAAEKGKNNTEFQTPGLDKEPSTRSSGLRDASIDSGHLQNTFLYLYSRNQQVQVVTATTWFQNFVPNRDLVILVHGAFYDPNYIDDYFNTLAYALLNESNYNVIGVNWNYLMVPETEEGHLEGNINILKLLGVMLYTVFTSQYPEFFSDNINTYYIGHDLATIPPIAFQETLKKPIKYVYGLNPRQDLPQSSYRLAQEHGEMVAILSTYNYPYSYGHKNIYAVPLDGPPPPAYKVLAKAITNGRTTATFCPNAEYFSNGYCGMLPHVPIWFTHSPRTEIFSKSFPFGRYYFYESPTLQSRCSGKNN